MDQQITPFLFEGEHTLRVATNEGNPLIVAMDVCSIIGIKNTSQTVEALDPDERGICSIYTHGGEQSVLAVTEGGFYTVILRSRQAMKQGSAAHRLRRFVTGEVLPQIRKTGSYIGGKPQDPNFCEIAEHDGMKLRIVTEGRHTFGTMAAGQLWMKLGLPTVPAMFNQPRQIDLFDYSAIRASAETA